MTQENPGPPATGRLLNQAAQGVMAWAVPLVVTFVTTPLIVHGLGANGFAVYAWATAFAAAIAAAGPSRGVVHLVSRVRQARPLQEAISTGMCAAVALGSLAALTLLVFAASAVGVAQLPDVAIPALRIAALGAVPAAAMAICLAALQGSARFGAAATSMGVAAVVTAAGSALVVVNGLGVLTLVAWQAAASLLACLASVMVLRRAVGPLWVPPTAAAAVSVARFGLVTIVTQLAHAAWVIVERTLVGRYLGPHAITALVVGLMMWMHANAAIVSATQVVAALAPAGASEGEDRLVRAYPSATTMTAIVAVALGALIAGLGFPALTLWIGHETAVIAAPLLLPLAIGVTLNGLATTAWFANEAEGRPVRNMVWAATGLVLTTVALMWLAPGGNITSAGTARLLAVSPAPLFIAWTERSSRGRLRGPWISILMYVVPAGIALYAGLRTAADAAAASWLVLIAAAATGIACYAAVLWVLPVLADRDRIALRGWLKSLTR
jgi:O-antigen/teichoic acid export membrane protein